MQVARSRRDHRGVRNAQEVTRSLALRELILETPRTSLLALVRRKVTPFTDASLARLEDLHILGVGCLREEGHTRYVVLMETVRSRRDEYSDATRRALLDAATELFARDGFAATSLDAVAAECRVTKGAVYHHFAGKQALFEEVLTESATTTCNAIVAAAAEHADVWDGANAGLDVFLARCQDPVYLRLCFQEGPAALGFTEWWAHGERYEMGLIGAMLAALKTEGLLDVDDVEVLTQLLFGSMTAAALSVARSADRAETSRRIKEVLTRVLVGLRPPPPRRRA